jgi:hypothetical protein
MSEPTDHDAGAERPHSLRRLLLRIGGTLVALLVLYLLSIGPAAYYVERRRAQNNSVTFPVLERIYAPEEGVPKKHTTYC